MFFNSKKKQADKLINTQAKELADGILNTFKVGLFETKYHPTTGQFTLPPTIYKDIYISGFIEHFINLNRAYFYNKDKLWSTDEVGNFTIYTYRHLKLSTEELELYLKLITDKNALKIWNEDGRYDLGKEHARLCFCCTFGIFAENENSKLMPKARKIAEKMPSIIGNETYEVKLASAMCELTIYDYLRKQFGGILIGKYDNFEEDKEEKNTKTENTKSEDKNNTKESLDSRIENFRKTTTTRKKEIEKAKQEKQTEFSEYKKRIIRNLKVFYDIELNLENKEDNFEFDIIIDNIEDNLNTLTGTIIVLNELLEPPNIHRFDIKCEYSDLIGYFNKTKTLIDEFNVNPNLIPFSEEIYNVKKGDFISHLDAEIKNIEDLKEHDEKQKYKSESILTEIFELHRSLIQTAKNSVREENDKRANNKISLETFFKLAEQIQDLLNKLEKYKNDDYTHNVKEILLLEQSITKVMQQKLYDEIKKQNKIEELNRNNLVKELILKDFEKLKKE